MTHNLIINIKGGLITVIGWVKKFISIALNDASDANVYVCAFDVIQEVKRQKSCFSSIIIFAHNRII